MRKVFGVVAVLVTVLGALMALPATRASAVSYRVADEAHIEQLTNGTRATVGTHPLAHQAGLQAMARAQAVRMAQRGDIYHNPNLSSDITALGVNWRMVGENVGMGPDADTVYAALLKSPHHYENIIRSNYTSIGIGEVDGPGNRVYLVQVFAQIVPSAPVVHAAAPVRPAPKAAAATVVRKPAPVTAARRRPIVAVAAKRPDPNALFGGIVQARTLLPSRPTLFQASGQASGGLLRRLARDVSFWA